MSAQVIYVQAGARGNGSSWASPLGDLHQALAAARPGTQIWVATGTYLTTASNDRSASFRIPSDIILLGGFAGTETSSSQRDWNKYPTVLSGEIGSLASADDNAFTVMYTSRASANTIIDGFVITGGNANQSIREGHIQSSGGGWFNDGSNGTSSPVVKNCLFIDNQGLYGAAIFNHGSMGSCNGTRIENCRFVTNAAELEGGAIYNNGAEGQCNTLVIRCHFEGNTATYGGCITNQANKGVANPLIETCYFLNNVAFVRGSCVYNKRLETGICNPVIQGCRHENNTEALGENTSAPRGVAQEDSKKPKQIIIRSTY
ncbi:MAG: hypothetical protein H6555_02580 [Lewinellaceae bacterium]|nr:hypothetical protein [Lewinellaceae bacterium]